VKRLFNQLRFGLVFGVYALVVMFFALAVRAQSAPATMPATAASRPELSSHDKAAKLASQAVENALVGNFEKSAANFKGAKALVSEDKNYDAGLKLVESYIALRTKFLKERKGQYAAAVKRVRRSFLVRDYIPTLVKAKLDKKLRKRVEAVTAAANRISNSSSLENAETADAAKMKTDSLKALDDAIKAVSKAAGIVAKDKSAYAQAFRGVAGTLTEKLKRYRQAWAKAVTTSAKQREASARRLHSQEGELAEAFVDLEDMVTDKPWRVGLYQARLARQLLKDKTQLCKEDWYAKLLAAAKADGKRFVSEANWQDALWVYASLEDLEADKEQWKEKVKVTERHVRVLNLYGKAAEKVKSDTKPVRPIVSWRDMSRGVDADMIKRAITQLNQYYVTAVDYRKLTRGGLRGVQVLAETPQAAKTFPGLGDKAKKQMFLNAITSAMENVKKRDRVTQLQLQMALDTVLRASERSVEIPLEVLAMEFADGFLDELDTFSSMIWPYDVPDFQKQIRGQFYGVGIQIGKEPGEPLRVVTPLPDTPAFRAGIKVDDLIIAVDGRTTKDMSVDKLIKMIMGPKGTKVVLRVKRPGVLKPIDFTIIRDRIRIETVKGWRRRFDSNGKSTWDYIIGPEGVAYIRVTQFADRTYADLVKALIKIRKQGVRSLVLDLRFNPGGMLTSATNVSNEFLRAGRIVSTRGRQVRQNEVNANRKGRYLDGDLVVLINEASASASEIVSGALKDWRRAIIVGQRSFGKGSVQNVIPIQDHVGYLKLTTAYYYLPTGRLLHRRNGAPTWGVDPDVSVLVTPKQMKRWLNTRRKNDLLDEKVAPAEQAAELTRQLNSDIQLRAAVLLLKLMKLKQAKVAA